MKWQHKAKIMQACASLPGRGKIYKLFQKVFGRLNADLMTRIPTQIEMARWILDHGMAIEGMRFFEVGTGHKPIAPIGFFLSGATSVITVDLHRRLDWKLTREFLAWIAENRKQIENIYSEVVDSPVLHERLDMVQQLWSHPRIFLKEANIQYRAPADAAKANLPSSSIDYHFSITTLEHIPPNTIKSILAEASRILAPDGIAIHFVDLSDHFQHQDKSITKINFLRFTEKEWLYIAGNEFAYCNRLRASDYFALFEKLSFRVLRTDTKIDYEALASIENGFMVDAPFKSYKPEDLCQTSLQIALKYGGNQKRSFREL